MRKLAALLPIALLATLATPAAAPAAPALPQPDLPLIAVAEEDEEEAGDGESAEEEAAEEIGCVIEDEEDVQLCAEIAREETEYLEAEKCVLKSASASVDASRGSGKVRLTVRYTTYRPSAFSLRYSLRGGNGGLRLGGAKARFDRAGVFHDVVRVNDRKMAKLIVAREFQIDLQALKTPGDCRERLTVRRHGASRLHWS
jgi:hypothetical protein